MAKKNKEIERLDFVGLTYYDERIKNWFQAKLNALDEKIKAIEQASGINTDWVLVDGTWDGDKHWYGSALWNGGEE